MERKARSSRLGIAVAGSRARVAVTTLVVLWLASLGMAMANSQPQDVSGIDLGSGSINDTQRCADCELLRIGMWVDPFG